MSAAKTAKQSKAALANTSKCLGDYVKDAMDKYFSDMDGHEPNNLHELVMSQVEKPLIESVINNARGNISRASELLGLNRGTLRNRMQKYGLDK
ncbi:MAG: Fis family transcriptional regulator [Gammaproteobacteria bacterium]|jgi:Fis family transcriptional regulator